MALDPAAFIGEFCKTSKEEIILILYNLFQKIEAEWIRPTLFYEASVNPNNKTRQRHYKKKKKIKPIPLVYIDTKILNKILASWIQQCVKKNFTQWPNMIYPRYASLVQYVKIS